MEGGSEAVSGPPPAGAMWGWGRAPVWSVEALDRFVCWMTYARLFDRFDLLGAWIDSEDQFSLALWDRSCVRRGALGLSVTADDWPEPQAEPPEGDGHDLLSRLRGATRGTDRHIVWNASSPIRREPWSRIPTPGDPARHGFHPDALSMSIPCAPRSRSRLSSATDLQYLYHGDLWASTMLWRMIDSVRGRWSAHLRLLAGWVTAPDEFLIIFQDATPVQDVRPPRRSQIKIRTGASGVRFGARIRSDAKIANPWDPAYIRPALDQLAEMTAATMSYGATRTVAPQFTTCEDGICWIWNRVTEPTPRTPWGAMYRRVLDTPVIGVEQSS